MMRHFFVTLLFLATFLVACAQAAPAQLQPATVYPAPQEAVTLPAGYPEPGATPEYTMKATPYPETASPAPTAQVQSDFAPRPGDEKFTRGNVYLEPNDVQLRVAESAPVQVTLKLKGTLPNPCYQLRVVISPPDEQHNIRVEAYSVADPAKICVDMLKNFEAEIPLGSYATGHYTVYLNDQLVGEFDG